MKSIYELGEFQVDDAAVILNEHLDWPMVRGIKEIEICKETFEKASRYCPNKMKEIFILENRPKKQCKQHSNPFSRFKEK